MKKILISTLPLGSNYGGIMQAYALQSVLRAEGYRPETTYSKGVLYKRIARSIPGLRPLYAKLRKSPHKKSSQEASLYTDKFVDKYIDTVSFDVAYFRSVLRRYSAYIAGSDQVWRNAYSYIPHNLFNYAPKGVKISYAASFGRDDLLEYDTRLIAKSRKLAGGFTAISVREDSGIDMVKHHWAGAAKHHVDPTLLIKRDEYERLIHDDETVIGSEGEVFVYVLDASRAARETVGGILTEVKLKPFKVISGDENNGAPMPAVAQWLRSFKDARFVVTDSFHGTVFSIIFNKPFIAIGNKDRGLARFTSLLKMFGLEDRLVVAGDVVSKDLLLRKIEWATVNEIIASERKKSLSYLKSNLS